MNCAARKILFVTYGGGHVDIVNRLISGIDSLSGIKYEILALTTAGTSVERSGFHFKRCSDYLPLSGYQQAMELGRQLSTGVWHESSGIPFDDSCAYLGVSMLDLIDEVGDAEAWASYQKDGRKCFCPVRFMGRVLDYENPDIIVTTCHVRMERAAVIAAKPRGIPSVRIEDLFGFSLLGGETLESNELIVPENEWPDHIFVLNEYIRDRLVKAGIPAERVRVTGQPVFSDWVSSYNSTLPEERLTSLREKGIPIITYASPAHRGFLYEQAKVIICLAERRRDWQFCIKLHPSIGVDEFLLEVKQVPDNIMLLQKEDILPVVKASDLVVLFRSTVGLLCIFCGVPLVVINWSEFPEPLSYISSGAAIGVDDHENLEVAIEESLRRRHHAELLDTLPAVYENPPNASQKIIECLVSLLDDKRSNARG